MNQNHRSSVSFSSTQNPPQKKTVFLKNTLQIISGQITTLSIRLSAYADAQGKLTPFLSGNNILVICKMLPRPRTILLKSQILQTARFYYTQKLKRKEGKLPLLQHMLAPNADHNLPQKSHTVRLMEGTEKASGTEPQKAVMCDT